MPLDVIAMPACDLVSIVIPCYNARKHLAETLESAFLQTYPHTEIIVVDDGSIDGTAELIRSYGSRVIAVEQLGHGQPFPCWFHDWRRVIGIPPTSFISQNRIVKSRIKKARVLSALFEQVGPIDWAATPAARMQIAWEG